MKVYTTKVIADFLDLSERRVRQLRDEKVIEEIRTGSGLYELKPTIRRYINYIRTSGEDEKLDYNTEKVKLMRAKRENKEMDLSIKKNELHKAEDIKNIVNAMLVNFKARLMAIPAKCSPQLSVKTDVKEIFGILKTNIYEALEELSDYDTAFAKAEESNEDINYE